MSEPSPSGSPLANAGRRLIDLMRSNFVSATGALVATFAFVCGMVTFAAQAAGILAGPYLGLFTFLILPAVFVLGLLLVPTGLLIFRPTVGDKMATIAESPFPVFKLLGVLTTVNVLLVGLAGGRGVQHMNSVAFCGETCHSAMGPQHEAFLRSPHSRLLCVDCHVEPGAEGFVRSKIDGVGQAWAMITDDVPRPIQAHHTRLPAAAQTCGRCHDPTRGSDPRFVVKSRTGEDGEERYTALLVRVGSAAEDDPHGAHWHSAAGVEVDYVASEDRREIPWIRLKRADGSVQVFTAEETETDDPPPGELRRMDCHDCHNRVGHDFPTLREGLDPKSPDALLYADQGIRRDTYPSFLGHDGCLRCHDGEHYDREGEVISFDCTSCHEILAQDTTEAGELERLGLRGRR